MRPVTFVICAAGEGTRLKTKDLIAPKPLLKLFGKTMLERSIDSLAAQPFDQIIVIAQKNHQLPLHFSHLLNINWIEIEHQTSGQLSTFMHSQDLILHQRVVIFNCDTEFSCPALRGLMDDDQFDGLVACSKATGDNWSFCAIDNQSQLTNIEEKKRISEHVSVGHYYFKDKDYLFKLARQELARLDVKEHYVAPIYKLYLGEQKKVSIVEVDEFKPFGSPEQVFEFWGLGLKELAQQQEM